MSAFIPGPVPLVRASEFMLFVYLDEFGHIGPYVTRKSRKHNESPVFGLAGIILPEDAVRPFATFFLKQKERTFAEDLARNGKMAAKWEKKGTSFIRPKPIKEYLECRRLLHRVLKKVGSMGGNVFYYGREKRIGVHDNLNPIGLYTTCFSHALQSLDALCSSRGESFVVVVDQHSARKELLECAVKTMYGIRPCRNLASPPFEVESYLNQNIQAADWVATLIGRLSAFELMPDEYADYDHLNSLFLDRISSLKTASKLDRRPKRRLQDPKTFDPSNPFVQALQGLASDST